MSLEAQIAELGLRPPPLDLDTIASVVGPTWKKGREDWLNIFPVLSREVVEEKSRPNQFDLALERELQHLQEVCHRPRLYLKVEEERVPVGRARRVPNRATASLLAHPEDWEHCTPQAIQPRRVLAIQMEDEWDLYENRVAVRLVDHLLRYVGGRLEELRKLQRLVDEEDYGKEAQGGGWRRQDRLRRLWNRIFSASKAGDQLQKTIQKIQKLYGHLLALLESPLYRHIPRAATVPSHLHSSNILVNDLHYRHVARLWKLWLDKTWKKPPTAEEREQRFQEERENFARFAELLVLQALGDQNLCGRQAEVITVRKAGSEVQLRVVLGRCPAEEGKAEKLWEILQEDPRPALMVGDHEDLQKLPEHLQRRFGGWDKPRILLVSPWVLDSVERVARLVAQELADQATCSYPPVLHVRSSEGLPTREGVLQQWPGQNRDIILGCLRPPPASLLEELINLLQRREEEDVHARQQRKAVGQNRSQHIQSVLKFLTELKMELPGPCPGCSGEAKLEVRPGKTPEQSTWWATCKSCETGWGWLRCGCGHRFSALRPYPERGGAEQELRTTQEMEQQFGRELEAEPCWRKGVIKWRCPRCGVCAWGSCERCRATPAILS